MYRDINAEEEIRNLRIFWEKNVLAWMSIP